MSCWFGEFTETVNLVAILGHRDRLAERIPEACLVKGVAVKRPNIGGDLSSASVGIPGTIANPVACVDTARPTGTEVGPPGRIASGGGCGEPLTVSVGAVGATEVRAIAQPRYW